MPKDEALYRIVSEWVRKAENDLISAKHLLTLRENQPTDSICFHAQQCAEKYLKALLTFQGIDFARTHDIARLLGLIPEGIAIELSDEKQALLTDYATTGRYPGAYETIDPDEAQEAVHDAEGVRKAVRDLLPPDSLKPY